MRFTWNYRILYHYVDIKTSNNLLLRSHFLFSGFIFFTFVFLFIVMCSSAARKECHFCLTVRLFAIRGVCFVLQKVLPII